MTFSSFVRRPSGPAAAATLGWLAAFVFVSAAQAAPPAGTPIGNQASASYLDATATPRTATSNLVTTIVQQVASFTLTANGARTAAPGGQVVFPHTLTNTGNGTDAFPLTLANLVGDDFDLTSLAIHVDANGDGVPDDFVNLATTGPLAAGGVFRFVVVGNVPGTQVGGQVGRMRVSGVSAFDGGQTASNTDVVTVSGNAVVSVTKSIDTPSGGSPSGPYTYTLTYTNSGNSAATNLRLADVIPAGMTYVAGSARWSVTGATVLTDADNGDAQGVVPNTVIWDYTGGTGTAVVAQVAPGASGTVTFQVNVNAGLAPQSIGNTATYSYHDGAANVGPFTTNNAPFTVNQAASLTFTGQTIASAVQGATLVYTNTLTNTGNGSDVFDITFGASTFPAGSSYQLYQSDGVTPLTDSNGNGSADTGPIAAGASYAVILQVTLPPSATGGPYQIVKTATSATSTTVSANATDVLTAIVPNAVDLTNDSPGPGAPGAGAGPEAAAVITNATNPNTTTRFTLYVNNNSTVADHFDLAASTDPSFATIAPPPGWTVVFRDAGNAIITNTGNLPAGDDVLVYADVTVPPGFAAGTYSLYFRARSPVSLASDRKHDAVTVNAVRSFTLVPNNVGQVTPGGAATYTHILSNTGNVLEGDGVVSVVSLAVTNTAASWSSALYVDSNNNGSLDGADAAIADLGSIFGLAAGTSVRLFVRVFSPPGAPLGATDLATLTATTTNGTYVSAVPPVVSATDQTTVLNGQLQIVKRQALDANCDGTPDGLYTMADITAGAIPGACLRYEIVVTNVGTASVTGVVVDDATPANTTYSDAIVASTSQGTITTPANGATGTVSANVGVLAPGASATITFGVRIDP